MTSSDAPSPLARALGRVPTGLYVVSTRAGDRPLGFVGSFLVQVGLAPPIVCVAVGKEPLSNVLSGVPESTSDDELSQVASSDIALFGSHNVVRLTCLTGVRCGR